VNKDVISVELIKGEESTLTYQKNKRKN